MEQKILCGTAVTNEKYIPSEYQPVIMFDSPNREMFAIDTPTVFKNILLTGGAGSGKTNVMNQIVMQSRQWHSNLSAFHFIFDTKADYINHKNFYQAGDYIIGNSPSFRNRSVTWNIFDEVLIDTDNDIPQDDEEEQEYEINAKEIAKVIFHGRGSKTQPFFADAARDIFAHTIIYFIRRYRDNYESWKDKLNNYELKKFLLRWGPKDFKNFFSIYPDMHGLISYFDTDAKGQAQSVFSELRSMVYECFQGVFAKKPTGNSFSIRKAVRSKMNRALFLEYDLAVGEILTPMYRLIVDLALKEALSENANGRVHFYLDELKLLPKVSHLQDALNFGRSKHVSVVAGIQNIDQLYTSYGESVAKEILQGFGSMFAFKATDHTTRDYVTQRFGPNVIAYRYHTHGNQPVDNVREGFTVEHWHQQNLIVGQAVVGLASQPHPFIFTFTKDPFDT